MARIYWQLVLNLMGDADNVLVLEGKALNLQDYRKEFGEQDNMQNIVKGAEIELWVFYGVYQKAAKLALEFGDKDNFFGGSTGFHDFFNRCMALYVGSANEESSQVFQACKQGQEDDSSMGQGWQSECQTLRLRT